jgi:hypothetical protein
MSDHFCRRLAHGIKKFILILACYLIPHLPVSNKWKMEELSRRTIEALTGKKFVSVRPAWLRNPMTGKNLELDGYNEELSIALEYNGWQHYRYVPRFHKCAGDLEKQIYRDQLKKKLCTLNGIDLIIVPPTIDRFHLCSYILEKLRLIREHRRSIQLQI